MLGALIQDAVLDRLRESRVEWRSHGYIVTALARTSEPHRIDITLAWSSQPLAAAVLRLE